MFQVRKVSECRVRQLEGLDGGSSNVGIIQPCERYLVLTQNGYIFECEDDDVNKDSADLEPMGKKLLVVEAPCLIVVL